jgi:pyruvate formate lyase activating enzyme
LRILGFIESSLVDWDGKLVSVIFLGGCNFKCPFCQNYKLADDSKNLKEISWKTIAQKLTEKKEWLDGVVISGGEPCMHPEIYGLCRKIKNLGFKIKIDTNGYYPYILMRLIENKLIDYVAMDIKTALDSHYYKACGRKLDLLLIKRTINLLLSDLIDYEFRTTLVRNMVGAAEIKQIVKLISKAKIFVLQQFVPDNARAAVYRKKKTYSKSEAEFFIAITKPHIKKVKLRGKFV